MDFRITTKKKELRRERYNRTVRGYCNGRLANVIICLKRNLWFFNVCTRLNKKKYYCKKLVVTALQCILTPLLLIVEIFTLVVTYSFAILFVNNNYD